MAWHSACWATARLPPVRHSRTSPESQAPSGTPGPAPGPAHPTPPAPNPQIGALLVFAEYDRNRKKEVKKQKREQAERQEIMQRAREEREVGSARGAHVVCSAGFGTAA